MKKLMAFILKAAMVLSLSACGLQNSSASAAPEENPGSLSDVQYTDSSENSEQIDYTPVFPQHKPYGTGIGAMPGRVVWAHNSESVNWDGMGYWWQPEHFDEAVIQNMVDRGISALAGAADAKSGWDALFSTHNASKGKPGGYRNGQKIAIKANINGSAVYDDDTSGETHLSYTNPILLKTLLTSLVLEAGVAPSDITVYDVSRLFPDYMVEMCTNGILQGVNFIGRNNGAADESAPINWAYSFSGTVNYLPICVTEAEYVINLANLKGHSYGITLCGKNHFGSFINGNKMRPPEGANLHQFLTRNEMGIYSPLTDLTANAHFGGKTVLYMLDALICAATEGDSISGNNEKWQQTPFNNDYTSSVFLSQDPVAIDSVGADFLINEPAVTGRNSTLLNNPNVENYLHESSLVAHAPSGTVYYDGSGEITANLGVHEHWNNPVQKQYSRNLGKSEGVELVYLNTGNSGSYTSFSKYSDVAADAWYAEAVAYCRENAIMSGVSDTEFEPQTIVSRAMAATVLWRMDGSKTATEALGFNDVESGSWYTEAIQWAVQAKVISGYSSTAFGVNDPVTKEQIIAMLYRYEQYKNGIPAVTGNPAFSDSDSISEWARTAVAWAASRGIVSKEQSNEFDPKAGVSRASTAVMLYLYLNGSEAEVQSNSTAEQEQKPSAGKTLVAYFSRSGNTKSMAEYIQQQTGGDLFEVKTASAYPVAYNDVLAQARSELQENARPEIAASIDNMNDYETVFIGYPIWHGTCPRVILTFLEEYDMSGKTVIPFCTSGSTGISRSVRDIREVCSDSAVLDGLGVSNSTAGSTQSAVNVWLDNLDLPAAPAADSNTISLQFNGKTFTAELTDNSSAAALKELLAAGSVTINMRDYGNMEKVGELSASLPRNDEQIRTEPGDLILYQGNSFVIYYASNSWSLTRLGKIKDATGNELREALGSGDVTVTLTMNLN